MSTPAIKNDGSNVLQEAPENFEPTAYIAWLVGRFDTERTLAQKWKHQFNSKDDVWVVVPNFLLYDDAGMACSIKA